MSLVLRGGIALALLIAVPAAAQPAPKPVEKLYAECHKRIVTPKGKFKDGDPKTDEAIEECIRKRQGGGGGGGGGAPKPAPRA